MEYIEIRNQFFICKAQLMPSGLWDLAAFKIDEPEKEIVASYEKAWTETQVFEYFKDVIRMFEEFKK